MLKNLKNSLKNCSNFFLHFFDPMLDLFPEPYNNNFQKINKKAMVIESIKIAKIFFSHVIFHEKQKKQQSSNFY